VAAEPEVVDAVEVTEDHPTPEPSPAARPEPEATTALAVRPSGSTELIAAESAADRVAIATEIATALDAVIRKQGMRTKVGRTKVTDEQGRETWTDKWHVNIEGWQTLSLLLGLAVIPHDPHPLRDDAGQVIYADYDVERFFYPKGTAARAIRDGSAQPERVERARVTGVLGYRCRVEVFKDGVLVGAGNGRCDRNEEAWRDRPDYAPGGHGRDPRAVARDRRDRSVDRHSGRLLRDPGRGDARSGVAW
jgi:hypothetical protein